MPRKFKCLKAPIPSIQPSPSACQCQLTMNRKPPLPLPLSLINLSLRDQLDDTTSLDDLPLSLLAEISGAHDDGDGWETALAADLGVAQRQEVEDGHGVLLGALGEVGVALLGGDQGPELFVVEVCVSMIPSFCDVSSSNEL
jgi:hypothetical protein